MGRYDRTIARLRGVCILVVLLSHYKYRFHIPTPYAPAALWTNGFFGVIAFFVISGYLITSTIIARYGALGSVRPLDFYIRRAARIVPPLLLLLAVLSAFSGSTIKGLAIPPDQSLPEMLWYAITFRFNLYAQHISGHAVISWLILWSLSVEEVFYLIYPLLAVLLKSRWRFVTMLGCVMAAGIAERMTAASADAAAYGYFACFHSIALGVLIALVAPRYAGSFGRFPSLAIMMVGAFIAAVTYLAPTGDRVLDPELISVGTAMLLFGSRCGPMAQRGSTIWDPLAFLGDCSYELYLFHFVLFCLLYTALRPIIGAMPDLLVFIVVLGGTIPACAAIRLLYAEPMNRLLRRLLDAGDRPAGMVMERRAAS